MGSENGDEATGLMPDENYERELLQFFTILLTGQGHLTYKILHLNIKVCCGTHWVVVR